MGIKIVIPFDGYVKLSVFSYTWFIMLFNTILNHTKIVLGINNRHQ
jgi:hypothetical protein